MRTGCLEHDPALAAALPVVRFGATPVPARFVQKLDWTPLLGDNDTLPTCVPTALANASRALVKRLCGPTDDVAIPTSAITTLFADTIGMPGATDAQLAATDGCDPLALFALAQADGWNIGGQVPLVPTYGLLPNSRLEIARAIVRLGACPVAVTLYQSDMEDAAAGRNWVLAPAGNVVGGHMICPADYLGLDDTDLLSVATWGKWQRMSWRWLAQRIRLAVPVVSRSLLGPARADQYSAICAEAGLVG